jgi:mono/diheme cytochrome c family protein
VVAGLISPGAISALIRNYVWGWAIEWTFFIVEIVAALLYYATWDKISKEAHLLIGWVYFIAAYLSLVIINGIITFMLTPGQWLETHAFWDGFFNPTYWPGLLLRTGICAMMAAAFLLFASRRAAPAAQPRLARYLGLWLLVGALVSYAGFRWWEAALPPAVLELYRSDAPVMAALAATRAVSLWALAAAVVFAALLFVTRPRAVRAAIVVLLAVASFTFFGAYERLREGVRKPYLIHDYLFSNGLKLDDIERVNAQGLSALSGWVARAEGDGAESRGQVIFRTQCSICHSLDGYQAIRPLLPTTADMVALAADAPAGSGERTFQSECASCHRGRTYEEMRASLPAADEIRRDPSFIRELDTMMISATLQKLREMGLVYAEAGRTGAVKVQYPQMPPLVGSDGDLEALAAYLASLELAVPAGALAAPAGGGQ